MDTQELGLAILHRLIGDYPAIGKTRLQKFGYFLQEAMGLPTEYHFHMHHYGPYSESLDTNISRLKLAGYVDIELNTDGYGYEISQIDNPTEEWKSLIQNHLQKLTTLEEQMSQLSTSEIELWATIHFVQHLRRDDESSGQVMSNVKALKPKFDLPRIEKAQTDLERWLGMVEHSSRKK